MTTSLKTPYVDEIAENMAKAFGDEFIKTAQTRVDGPLFAAFKKAVDMAASEEELDAVHNVYLGAGGEKNEALVDEMYDTMPAQKYEFDRRKKLMMFADDGQPADDQLQENVDFVAANFVLESLTKVANTLDDKGCDKFADILDEAMQKVSKKK